VLGTLETIQEWQWAAFGKHPAAKDYFRLGENTPFIEGLYGWVEKGYRILSDDVNASPDFCSWRFCAREAGKDFLVCGVVRLSSDSFGRTYPLVIMGSGALRGWQENWDLLPFACEKTWRQIEYLASNLYSTFNKLEEEIQAIRPPIADWPGLAEKRRDLNAFGSTLDPYASFLDLGELKKLAAAGKGRPEVLVSLDRGPCFDKILHVSLWHLLLKEYLPDFPNVLFMGGTLEKALLVLFQRPLKSTDFTLLWSVSSGGLWKNMIGTEYSMDLSQVGRQPISADKPAGSDIRYDPAFDELQTEVDKLTSPALAGSVNWEKVCRFASDILMHKSKDLLVAGYLTVGLIHTRMNDGFTMGITVFGDLCERFWDDLFPSRIRMRGRVRAIEWLLERCNTSLRQMQNLSFPPSQVSLIKETLNKMEIFLGENLENTPSFAALNDYFSGLDGPMEEVLRPEALLQPESESREETLQTAQHREREPMQESRQEQEEHVKTANSSQEAASMVSEALKILREASFCLRQQDPTSPQAYRLARKAAWYAVEDLPPAQNGRTRIPPPTSLEKKLLFDLRNNGDAEALLKVAEARLSQYIFWVDLNRFSADSLSRLGNRYEKAYDAVCQETAFLLHRLPGLEDLCFSDGTPFVATETRQWLQGIVFRGGPGDTVSAKISSAVDEGGAEENMGKTIEELQLLIRKGRLVEAMEEGQRKVRDGSSRQEKLLWRLSLAHMLVTMGKTKLSLPYLEHVLEDIDCHGLEEYDPELALRGLKLCWQAFETQAELSFKERAAHVLHRIGRLDMPEMVRLAKE
jgi:type VI secretion system protein VasJ